MPYLWTWYDYIEFGIPNTNNALEGKFMDLKTKLRNHNGLPREHNKVFIDEYFGMIFFEKYETTSVETLIFFSKILCI